MISSLFKGTGRFTTLILRQERLKILIWLVGLIAVTLAAASAYPGVYPDEQSRQGFALTVDNPAMVAMIGPGYALEDYSLGAIFANEMLLFTAIAAAIMSILLVGRSTRASEEDGRIEMIRALPTGRLAYLSASLIVLVMTNIVLALLTGIGIHALEIDGIDFNGAILYGFLLGGTGIVFGAIAALFAQLAETSRGTTMLTFATLIIAYLIRAVGDVSSEALSFVSPLGWTVRAEVFVGNEWWPVLFSVGIGVVILGIAFYLNSIRDLDAGFIPSRKGKRHASAFLKTPLGLTFRLQRTNIISWAIGIFLLSASFGSIMGDLETYFSENEFVQSYLAMDPEYSLTEQFITLLLAIMSTISAIPAVMTVLKLKAEETKNRTEHFYSRAYSRTLVLGNYFFLAIVISFVMQALNAIGLWSVGASVMEDPVSFGTIFGGAMAYMPAMLIMIALAVLAIGAFPKATPVVWLYVVFCFIIVYLGELLDFPEWVTNLSSFTHVPQIPIDEMTVTPMVVLTVVSIIVSLAGFVFYNKRDITG